MGTYVICIHTCIDKNKSTFFKSKKRAEYIVQWENTCLSEQRFKLNPQDWEKKNSAVIFQGLMSMGDYFVHVYNDE